MKRPLKSYSKLSILSILAVVLSSISFSQTITYTFDGQSRTYKAVYKAELTKNSDEFNVNLLEEKLPDLDKLQDGVLINHPEAMNILIVGMTQCFPIKMDKPLVMKTTQFERGMSEYEQGNEIADKTRAVLKDSKPRLDAEIKKREEKMKQLSKRIQQGDMAAMDELQKVAAELEAIISGEMEKLPDDEIELTSQYFGVFINMPSQDKSRWLNVLPVSGVLTVEILNEKQFKGRFSGLGIYESGKIEDAQPLTVEWNVPLTEFKN
ncbi:hypothetical protein BST97_08510 [Nonlabens spongiae]|uniref:Uncharacterized protein n=1 Tax=Nonlabens spongiae TaxID=331648 RepID=A0A1W6MKD8_9FLAO|nr:hypothetical protein [Nonlabens spongiae]ARN78037.1 hypothetical protein BST97_08510 [Nonlabens spongiae]